MVVCEYVVAYCYVCLVVWYCSESYSSVSCYVCPVSKLNPSTQRIVDELVKNAAQHSKGHNLKVDIAEKLIVVSDDGQGMLGVAESVENLGGQIFVSTNKSGTRIEIRLP